MGVLFAAFDHCIDQAGRIKKCVDELLVLPAVALSDFQSRGGLTDEGEGTCLITEADSGFSYPPP